MADDKTYLIIIKASSMVIMFTMIMVLGNLPLRWQRFRKSSKLISLASGFSGGLFLAVGVLHLLPEAREAFDDYYASKDIEDPDDEFPWSNFLCVICFALVLFIEKVAFASLMGHDHGGSVRGGSHGGSHVSGGEEHAHLPVGLKLNHSRDTDKNIPLLRESERVSIVHKLEDEDDSYQRDAQTKTKPVFQIAHTASVLSKADRHEKKISKLTPYILQIAIGIHATFEGMAIGLENEVASCIGISLAVVCHKWAEGLTLGIAFFKADVELRMASIMIGIQAIMNPIGIMIGWILSDQGDLIRGIFESISAGTFLYIAAAEVIVNEFNLKRYRYLKFALFLCAIGFVTSLFFIEQATGA